MKAEEKRIYEFGEFRLDAGELELYRQDERLALPQKSLEMLAFLIERRGQTVTKNELLDEVWRDTFVDENNLAVNVAALRRAFGVKATDKNFIETVSGRGYRFTADVRETGANGGDFVIEKLTETRIAVNETTETLEPANKINALQTRLRRHSIALVVVAAFVLGLGIFLVYSFRSSPQPKNLAETNAPRTIAVLPLKNLSGANETDESLNIGLTDALITELGNIRGLAVRPTSAVLPFALSKETPQTIGEKLNVEAILESSIQRVGNRLRVSVQLVKTADGAILWSENFDETEADLFKIQDSISVRVADAFRLKNTETANRRTEDFEAYKLYLRGRHSWNKRTPEGLTESIKLFNQAIDRDPTFALAFAGLADSYALLSEYNLAPPRDSFPQAKAAAQKALEIDQNLAEAHTTLAYALANYDWNFTEAEREYRRAIELNPNYATAHQWYAEFLSAMKRFDEAKAEIKRAQELDPLSPIIQSIVGLIFYHSKDFDAAIVQYQKTINNHPNFPIVYAYLSLAYAKKGMFDEAFEAEIKLRQTAGADEKAVESLRQIYRQNGWKSFLETLLAGTNAEAQKHYVNAFAQAFLYMRMNEREQSLEWLEKSYAERHRYVVYLNADPYADFLRDDARFQDLIRRVGLEN